jgi:hypothetical protein
MEEHLPPGIQLPDRDEELRLMPGEIIDWTAPSLQRTLPALPKDLPHGLVAPPQEVRDHIAALDEKLLREHGFTMNEEARVRELNHHTLTISLQGVRPS